MEYLKTLRNNNTIFSGYRDQRYGQRATDFSIRFVFSGNEQYTIGRRQLCIYPDSFLILNRGTQFSSTTGAELSAQSFFITFDQQFLTDFKNCWQLNNTQLLDKYGYNGQQDYEFNETIYPFMGDLVFNIAHLKNNLDHGVQDELLINEYLYHCLFNFHHIYNEELFKKAEQLSFMNNSTKIEILRRLSLAKEYLYSNYNNNVCLEDLAAYSCLSVNHLLRTFKQAFKITPHQFLVQLRLQRSKQLLKKTGYPVSEIVNMVGFECPSSFTRLFKYNYRVTPLKYRQSA